MAYKNYNEDITEAGVGPLQGLKGMNQGPTQEEPVKVKAPKKAGEFQFELNPYARPDYGKIHDTIDFDALVEGTGQKAYGQRRVDPGFITDYQLENLEDTRAQRQSDFAKVFNGTVKGVTTAGTTFLNGTAGLLVGLGTGVINMFDSDEKSTFVSGIWNNVFNDLMNKANEKMEEILPNYYTNDEREHPLRHIFNANFIGDKFIKNFGFTVGAMGSALAFGGTYGSLGHIIGKTAMGLGAGGRAAVGISKAVTMGTGAVAAAVAEGSIEALQTANQMKKENEELYKNQRDQNIAQIMDNDSLSDDEKQMLINDEERKYNEAMVKLTEDRTKAGNLDFLLNIPILTASNIIQFNKLLGNGYRSGKRIANVTGKMGNLKPGDFLDRSKIGRGVKALAKSGLAEGNEEVQQQIASDVSNNLYSLKLNDYYKSTIDPQANAQATNYIKATGTQILSTLGREDTWEQFIIGGLTGILGMPVFGKENTTQKADLGKGRRVGIAGGFFGQLNEVNEEYNRNKDVADYLNKRMSDPKFKEQYQGLVRHIYFQDKMDAALDAGLEKEYKDSEFAMLYNDIMMFMSAGKKDVLVDMIKDASSNITDEQAASLIEYTTEKAKDGSGKESGRLFNKSGSPMTADEVRDYIKKNADEVLKAVDKIEEAFDSLDYNTGGKLSNEQLQQLTYMSMQAENWLERTKEVGKDVSSFFDSVKNNLQGRLDANKARLSANPNDSLAASNISALENNMKSVDAIVQGIQQHTSLEKLGLIKHKDARAAYNEAINTINSKYIRGLVSEEEADAVTGKLKDLIKMSYSMELFQNKRDSYMKNPDLITSDNAEVLKQMEDADNEEQVNNVVEKLGQAESLDDFEAIVNDFNNPEVTDKAIDTMVKSDHQLAKQYKDNNAVADRQKKFVDELAGKEQEIPTLEGGKTTVTAEDADDIKKIIEFRRRTVGLKDDKFNPTAMVSPYLDDLDAVDAETGVDYWWNILGIDRETEEGRERAKHIRDVFAYVVRTGNQRVSEGNLVDPILVPEPEKKPGPVTTGADNVATVPEEEISSSTVDKILPNLKDYQVEIPYGTTTWDEATKSTKTSQGKSKIIDVAGRKIVVLNIGGINVPFYLSTGQGGKKSVSPGKWYPFFGISEGDNWINKLSEQEINDYYGSEELKLLSQKLDELYGDIRNDNSIPKVAPSQIGISLAVINKDVSPTENGTQDTRKIVEKNVAKIVEALRNFVPTVSTTEVDESKGSGELSDEDKRIEKELEETKLKTRGTERDTEREIEKGEDGKKKYWKNNIPQYGVKEMKEGRIEPPKIGGNPYLLHGVLSKLGAYTYANAGNIHEGDKVKFVINPEWTEHVRTLTTDTGLQETLLRTVFIVKEADNQVIGVLPPSNTGIAPRYSGLLEFVSWAEDRYEEETRDGNTIPRGGLDLGVSTTVNAVMNGFTFYNGEETNLKTFGKPFEFSWEQISVGAKTHKVLHLSIPNNSSKPMVQIGRLNSDFLANRKDTAFFKHFEKSITALAKSIIDKHSGSYFAITDDEAKELKFALQEFVFMYSDTTDEIHVNANDNGIVISGRNFEDIYINFFHTRQIPGGISITGTSTAGSLEIASTEKPADVATSIIESIAKLSLPVQVDFMRIGDAKYMQERIDAEVLSVGTSDIETKDVWFTLNPVEKEGNTFVSAAEEKNPTKDESTVGQQAATVAEAAETPKETPIPEPETKGKGKREIKRGGKKKFRIADEKEYKIFQKDAEMKWLDKALPQLNEEERVLFTKGLIRVASMGKDAWGKFDKGIITLSDIAAEGTIYHEAFHAVFNMMLHPAERRALFNEARRLWPKVSDELTLEENMAEEFRRYVMHKMDNTKPKTLRERIERLFRSIWQKIRSWESKTMYTYFAQINDGYYAGKPLGDTDATRYREYNPDNKEELKAHTELSKIWDSANEGKLLEYEVDGRPHYVPVRRRTNGGIEFRFRSRREAEAFEDYFRNKYFATFSKLWENKDYGYYRSYMQKPTLMSNEDVQEIRRLSELQESPFDRLADYQKSELTARGYTKEDFDELTEPEQEALRECFFTM